MTLTHETATINREAWDAMQAELNQRNRESMDRLMSRFEEMAQRVESEEAALVIGNSIDNRPGDEPGELTDREHAAMLADWFAEIDARYQWERDMARAEKAAAMLTCNVGFGFDPPF